MTITDKTSIQLGTVFTLISILVGAIMWLNSVDTNAKTASITVSSVKDDVAEIKADMKDIKNQNIKILERLSRIEGRRVK